MNVPSHRLIVLGIGSWLCYLAIAFSARSLHVSQSGDHMLLLQLALFAAAFGLYLAAVRSVRRINESRRTLAIIWIGAIYFRLTLLVSDPIEEIDLYRYVWDGAVSTNRVNPFRYTPQQVLASSPHDSLPPDLAQLVALREQSPELTEILKKVHFGELPTIYPPVSQIVFAACSWLTPEGSSASTRMTLMKAWFVAFDLATLALVLRLLSQAGRHRGWAIAYGWCPLVIKEIANSGHLDALATCLMTLAVSLLLSALATNSDRPARRCWLSVGAALALALGVGAKLYPVVLAPLLLWMLARRVSVKVSAIAAVIFVTVSLLVLCPMIPTHRAASNELVETSRAFNDAHVSVVADQPPLPPPEASTEPRDPSESLRAFLGRWEMNDFLFLLVIENLRPSSGLPTEQIAWFTVTPESWRAALVATVVQQTGLAAERVPFVLTRLLLSLTFVGLAVGLALWAAVRTSDAENQRHERLLEATFLTLAWFWLLLPTQNPWYLTWCLPFLPFARSRAWFALSGLAFVYYLRFWMTAQFSSPLLGTSYPGPQFFDYVVTWLEYVPWLVCLVWHRRREGFFFRRAAEFVSSGSNGMALGKTHSPIRAVLLYFCASFLMHLIWENAQMPLYEVGEPSLWNNFMMCLFATATGDMLFTIVLYLTVVVIHKNLWWPNDRAAYLHPATWTVPVLLGTLLAVSFELWAIHAVQRWQYGSMPIVPVIRVGLTPVLQMIVIPIVATALCRLLANASSIEGQRK